MKVQRATSFIKGEWKLQKRDTEWFQIYKVEEDHGLKRKKSDTKGS